MKISIFGSGYVGLVTGTCLAEFGNEVLCCDVDPKKIDLLKQGKPPFYEPGLEEMLQRNIEQKRLLFTINGTEAIQDANIIFIAVGTPPMSNGGADLSYVYAVAKTIGENLEKDGVVVVTKSTVPVGTTKKVKEIILEALKLRNKTITFSVANNPEFLREGKALEDFMIPDRVVIGVEDEIAKTALGNLYFPQTKNGHPLYFMDIASSEMTKYASNAFIAARISLINEVAQICEQVGANVEKVRIAVGADKRIGHKYLYPGVGYGGSCFPKDIQALAKIAKDSGIAAKLIEGIEETNELQKKAFAEKIIKRLDPGSRVALWGLSFKPQTDDMRAAPSLDVIELLLKQRFQITAYDPVAMQTAKNILGDKIAFAEEMYETLTNADALILITEWMQFKEPDFGKIKSLLKQPIIFDGRNIYSPERMKELGLNYISIGRPRLN